MPALNKQSLINLLIDSPLREAIKINLIDIVNNTNDTDLDKTYSTISKELEIYQKATERRLKLAGETIAQLSGTPAPTAPGDTVSPYTETSALPPLPPLPPMPQAPVEAPKEAPTTFAAREPMAPLQVPPLDLPPMPVMPSMTAPIEAPAAPVTMPTMPIAEPAASQATDDDAALAEIQKELDALKNSASSDLPVPNGATAQ